MLNAICKALHIDVQPNEDKSTTSSNSSCGNNTFNSKIDEDYNMQHDTQNIFKTDTFPNYPEHIPHDNMTCDTSESEYSSDEDASIEIFTYPAVDSKCTVDPML